MTTIEGGFECGTIRNATFFLVTMCTADRVTSPDPNLPYWRKRISNADSLPRNRDLHTYRSAPNISQEKKVALATANFATKRSFCEENATAAKGPCCSCILEQCNLTNLQWHTYFASPPAFSKRGFYYPASKSFWPDELTLVSHVLRRKENSDR